MIVIEREVAVAAPLERVFDYLSDFTSTEEWDPGTVRTSLVSGNGGVGTTFLRKPFDHLGEEAEEGLRNALGKLAA
ncbi:SRPBCC family protein [Kribbella sp. NPDC004536]|uniref:SRPBCC family protein n=1 Tax=Kribbella sp. NPDC004536 TaxID=3364106 RepID=UPI003681B4C9